MITGIVVALPEELSTLTKQKIAKGGVVSMGHHLLLALSGTGSANASLAGQRLIAQGATQLMSWGCAAAVSETLKSGDLVLPKSLVDLSSAENKLVDVSTPWQAHCERLLATQLTVVSGLLVTSSGIIATSGDKRGLWAQTGADAVDMESVAVALVAKQHQVPFAAIRAIADPAAMDLPAAISVALNPEGEVVVSKLMKYLLLHPTELPGLIQVALQFNAARKTLKTAAKVLNQLTCF